MATIEGMFRSEDLGDKHPQCTFPARFAWLKKQLDLDLTQVPKPDCNSLNKWKVELNVDHVSLIFASAYLNNPSSMFGHTFLRFDPPDKSEGALLVAYSINFAAETSEQKGMMDYIYKGLSGGFPTEMTIQPFYKMFRTYSDIESRDIWEYRLNLPSEELEMVVLHLWELKGRVFDYFFLDENCSYRVMGLLEVAFPEFGLTENYTVYTTPVDTVRTLSEHGIIESKRYRASATKTLFHHAETLTAAERRIVIDIVKKRLPLDSKRLSVLPEKRKALVLALGSEYLTILINQDALDRKMSSQLTHGLLTERGKLSMPVTFDDVPEPFSSPDLGHKGHRLRLGSGYIEGGFFYSIGYRNNYHSLLDPIPGYEKGAQIEFFNTEIHVSEKTKVEIENLSILNITSLTPVNEFFRPVSWSLSFGAERKFLNSDRPLVYSLEFERGLSYKLRNYLLSGMADVSFDINSVFEDGYGLGIGLNSRLTYQGYRVSYNFGISTMKYMLGDGSSLHNVWGEISYPLNNNNAIYLCGRDSLNSGRSNEEISLGLKHYF